ncbi:hypothetical protein ACMA5I_14035 [Paracoccaceae bacterium GXU_MW_L88]
MDELPDPIYDRVTELSELGNGALDASQYDAAIGYWRSALALLPAPQAQWDAAMWLHASIGDAYREKGAMEDALSSFQSADAAGDGHANAFVQFSLGATLYDLGRRDDAVDPLLRAYMLEGEEIFEPDDVSYLEFLRSRVRL